MSGALVAAPAAPPLRRVRAVAGSTWLALNAAILAPARGYLPFDRPNRGFGIAGGGWAGGAPGGMDGCASGLGVQNQA
jgi:hypothetical protein